MKKLTLAIVLIVSASFTFASINSKNCQCKYGGWLENCDPTAGQS